MSTTYADCLSAIVAYLQSSGTTLYSYVGVNVFKDQMIDGYDLSYPALVVLHEGERPWYSANLDDWTLHIRCYGRSLDEARAVYRALLPLLHGQRCKIQGDQNIVIGTCDNMTAAIEPDTEFPVVNAMFSITSLRTVAA